MLHLNSKIKRETTLWCNKELFAQVPNSTKIWWKVTQSPNSISMTSISVINCSYQSILETATGFSRSCDSTFSTNKLIYVGMIQREVLATVPCVAAHIRMRHGSRTLRGRAHPTTTRRACPARPRTSDWRPRILQPWFQTFESDDRPGGPDVGPTQNFDLWKCKHQYFQISGRKMQSRCDTEEWNWSESCCAHFVTIKPCDNLI